MTNLPQSVRRRLEAQHAGDHPDAGLLTAFAEQALSPAERNTMLAHLASCAVCREVVALSLPEEAVVKEAAPLAPWWFRWPLLRWSAVVATAVIVWAAVAVLVPRRPERDISVPAPSAMKEENEQRVAPAAPQREAQVVPAPHSAPQITQPREQLAANAAPPRPTKRMVARDKSPAENAPTAENASVGKLKTAPPAAMDTVASGTRPLPTPPPPPPPPPAEQKAEVAKSSAAGALVAGALPQAGRQLPAMAANRAVGGPVRKDADKLDFNSVTPTAVVAGKVTDSSGAVVPNAVVKITNAQTNYSTDVVTDSGGTYRAPVSPGVYSIEAASPGMQAVKTAPVTVDGTLAQNFTLRPGAASETVSVTAESAEVVAPVARSTAKLEQKSAAAGAQAGIAGGADSLSKKYKAWIEPRWRVTPDGTLQKSIDGKSWTRAENVPGARLRVADGMGADVWAGGDGGALFHSSDAGATWQPVKVCDDGTCVQDRILGIVVLSTGRVVVETTARERWQSGDRGQSWRRSK